MNRTFTTHLLTCQDMDPYLVDFHCHSTSSDGSLSAKDLVTLAHKQGVAWMALTDHDTTAGLAAASEQAERLGLKFTSGIELSSIWEVGHCHILGYGFDPHDRALQETLKGVQKVRSQRIVKMIAKLNELGCPLTLADLKLVKGASPGRPHLAEAMVRFGVVETMEQAFKTYLCQGGPVYVDKETLTAQEAFQLIRAAGGLPVLAHPHSLHLRKQPFGDQLAQFKEQGLAGIEAYHSSHSRNQCNRLVRLAGELGLWVSGGSDFHGKAKPWVKMGRLKKGRKVLSRWISPEFFATLSATS